METTVLLKGKLTVTRELRNSTQDSFLENFENRVSSQVSQLTSWIFQVSSQEKLMSLLLE